MTYNVSSGTLNPTIPIPYLTDIRFISLLAKIFKKNTNYFYAIRISISLAILPEMSFKLVTFSKSYARKQKWVFFSEHSVYTIIGQLRYTYIDQNLHYKYLSVHK